MATKRIDTLKSEHRKLDSQIQLEYRKYDPNDARIAELKRLKLRLKDQIVHSH